MNPSAKQYQSQVNEIDARIDGLKSEISIKTKMLNQQLSLRKELIDKIKNLNNPQETTVSEHALLRYIERVKGIDIEEIKTEIKTAIPRTLIEVLGGNGTYPCGDYSIILKNNVVTTVIT